MIMNNKLFSLNTVIIVAATMLLNGTASAQTYVKYKPNNNWQYVHKDYKLKFGPAKKDTTISIDPVNGDEILKETTTDPFVIMANDQKVYSIDEVSSPVENCDRLEKYLLKELSKTLKILHTQDDEMINIDLSRVVVNEQGKVIYYEYEGVYYKPKRGYISSVPIDLTNKVTKLMKKHPKLKPATVNGEKVIAYTNIWLSEYKITVKDNKVSYNIEQKKM